MRDFLGRICSFKVNIHKCPNSHRFPFWSDESPKYCPVCRISLVNHAGDSTTENPSDVHIRSSSSELNDNPITPADNTERTFAFIVYVEEPTEQLISMFQSNPSRIDYELLEQFKNHTMWYSSIAESNPVLIINLASKYQSSPVSDLSKGLAFVIANVPIEYKGIVSSALRTSLRQMWLSFAEQKSNAIIAGSSIVSIEILGDPTLKFVRS